MSLRRTYRAECDRPGCRAAVDLPHAQILHARRQLRALRWKIVRWLSGGPGAGRHIVLCPTDRGWRPPGPGRAAPPMQLEDD